MNEPVPPEGWKSLDEYFLQRAYEYAFAVSSLLGYSKDDDGNEEALEVFKTHFLFPNLSNEERGMIVTLSSVRRSLSIALNTADAGVTKEEKRIREAITRTAEAEFLSLRAQVSAIIPRLAPVQRRLLEIGYLEIKFHPPTEPAAPGNS